MEIALTFDDGPHPRLTPEILDILNEYGVSATFFVVGENVANYPEAAMRIANEGHEIGNHTYTHRHIQSMSKNQLMCEIESCERQIIEVTDDEYRTKLFRPPEGKVDSSVEELGEDLGYSVILWSIDTKDWAHTSVSKIVDNVLSNVKSGDIILMQLIVTPKLSKEQNLWLKHLTNRLKSDEVEPLIKEFRKHENEKLHKSVMDLIIHANNEVFKEAKNMCDALMELMKEELEESRCIGLQQGMEQIIRNALRKGHTPEQISDFADVSLEEVLAVQQAMAQEDNKEVVCNIS